STQWGDGFTEEDYKTLVKAIYNGEVKISNDISAMPATDVKVTDYGSIK
ncbi:MAG: BMP family ABC transporter substrate-binding protein, partial [Lachnospiraceae bacterium]|nr:BMP family ABC transporter substrate-binding protein [Lachnospiraceae bacterium]